MLHNHDSIRERFPFLKKYIYLDSAHYTPYPTHVVNSLNEFIKSFSEDYLNLSKFNISIAHELKQTVGKLIHADENDISITSCTTHGINIFANGINLDTNDSNVAFLNTEFPAVVYPWLNQEKLGRTKVFMIPSDKGYANETLIKHALLENNIRVFTISLVQFLGYRYNIKSIADFCRKNSILLVVDAIQCTGIIPIDVHAMDIDFLCAGNQKWMMSPAGTGFVYMSRKYREYINPTYVGTTSVNYDFDNFLDYNLDLRNDGGAYENSTLNTLGMIGMNEALKYFLELGVENIFSHIIDVQDKFIELIDKSKYQITSELSPKHRSNILIFTHNDHSLNKQIQKTLEEKNIYIALREGYLRISPHIYNNHADIETLTEELSKF